MDEHEQEYGREVTLGEYGPGRIFLVSVGVPTGVEIDLRRVEDPDTGEMVPLDPRDAESALPEGAWDLAGVAGEDGTWRWDGRGWPRDWNGNSVTRLDAWRAGP